MRAALFLALWPGLAAAQEMVFDPAPTEACLAASPDDLASCIGHAADACMLENPEGQTTMGMSFCLSREWEWWDARLNAAYAEQLATYEAGDAALKEEGLEVASIAGALREMQRAWIVWRDASCAFQRALWTDGSGGETATVLCLMQMTGARALDLEWSIGMPGAQ